MVQKKAVFIIGINNILRDIEIKRTEIFFPMLQLPCIPVGRSVDHSLMADLRICHDPYDCQLCTVLLELCSERRYVFIVTDFLCERCIDHNDIFIFDCLEGKIHNNLIFVVADLFFKEFRASVIGFAGNFEYLL